MSSWVSIRDRELIERFVRKDRGRHLYELGDLDPFFWPHTRWFGRRRDDGELATLALLYLGATLPTLLALSRDDDGATGALLEALADTLPDRVYAHLTPGLGRHLHPRFGRATPHGRHLKMVHRRHEDLGETSADDEEIERLTVTQLDALRSLYARSYPDNWFDERMLETGQYFGVRRDDRLVCVAGVHVFSPRYGVAALGNVTTDPDHRGRGLARRVTARLCRSLYEHVELIGLNVKADNAAAIACYQRLGFAVDGDYDEVLLEASPRPGPG